MGRVAGDKSRYNRKRRMNIARRAEMRALAKTLRENAADAKAAPRATTPSAS
jgi:hypothetical protein